MNTTVEAYDGERWDGVANRAYGDAKLMGLIIDANPNVGITDRLKGGTVLVVPVIDNSVGKVSSASVLPPWKTV